MPLSHEQWMQTLLAALPKVLGNSERWLHFPDKTFPPPPLRLRKGCRRGGRKNIKSWDIELNVTLCIWHSHGYHNLPAAAWFCTESTQWWLVNSQMWVRTRSRRHIHHSWTFCWGLTCVSFCALTGDLTRLQLTAQIPWSYIQMPWLS